jgi:uncharacterized protein (DUF927 family)
MAGACSCLVAERWRERAHKSIDGFVTEFVPKNADGQVWRAAGRFALIGSACELAEEWGIVPWGKGQARIAAQILFHAWLKDRGGIEPAEVSAGIAAVRLFLDLHGASRFEAETDPRFSVPYRAGFVRKEDDKQVFYVSPEVWKHEILAEFDVRLITRSMVERGFLKRGPDGKPQVLTTPPEGGKRRFYGVLAALFEDGGDPIAQVRNPKNLTANS